MLELDGMTTNMSLCSCRGAHLSHDGSPLKKLVLRELVLLLGPLPVVLFGLAFKAFVMLAPLLSTH